ncbi:polymorphic toxin type 44 domain-containing protein [uncultured Massilia sp.]|uniref:polymorphic toxin type 44 domain-containing protein n=1 Tax=uncultured Massilia sp. TaxID=169973 RepID=UPI0025EB1040|nr:polymorphic toxin type 44 domain-containing protein [uncultured Massilia sp.]
MSAVLDRNGRPMRLVGATNTTPVADRAAKTLHVCNHGNDVVGIAEYMVAEMKRNPFSEEGRKMTEANAYDMAKEMEAWNALPWYAKFGGPPDYAGIAAGKKMAAYSIWAERVAPNRPWDHKPILAERLRKQHIFRKGWQRYGNEDYFYDIWSNIHYGYVGVACGFSADELLGGAGLAQAGSDFLRDARKLRVPRIQHHPENGAWANRMDDIPDHISIKLGVDLYARAKPAALTTAILLRAIVGVPLPWGVGNDYAKRPHECTP